MTARDEAARLYATGIGTERVQTPVMDQIRAAVFAAAEDPAREQDLRALIDAHIGGGARDALLAQCLSVIQAARAAAGPEAMDHATTRRPGCSPRACCRTVAAAAPPASGSQALPYSSCCSPRSA